MGKKDGKSWMQTPPKPSEPQCTRTEDAIPHANFPAPAASRRLALTAAPMSFRASGWTPFSCWPIPPFRRHPEADLRACGRGRGRRLRGADTPLQPACVLHRAQHPQQRCRGPGDRAGGLAEGQARPRGPVPRRKPVPRPGPPALLATKPLRICAAPLPRIRRTRCHHIVAGVMRGPRPRGFVTRVDPVC